MYDKIQNDLDEVATKLKKYVQNGFFMNQIEVREEPRLIEVPNEAKLKPLEKVDATKIRFMAVDCSTRTLRRGHNWGIYLFRVSCVYVKNRDVKWNFEERIRMAEGSLRFRHYRVRTIRFELESEMALKNLDKLEENDYLLLDGASYFGEKKGFYLSLYQECQKRGINLLTISKQSPMLHDNKGRDLVATISALAENKFPCWVYHPVKKANKNEQLYGDVSLIKLCESSPRIFRCDIMEYLTNKNIDELLSPLTGISEDPRCLGYPVVLWLAHDFSRPSNSKLLYYYEQVRKKLAESRLLERLQREELSCNFPQTLHGIKYPFEMEPIDYV